MKRMATVAPVVLLAFLGGCAPLPMGPSVNVLPARGKSFETFSREDATCRQWAERQVGIRPNDAYEQNVATGAMTGTVVGAGLGAFLGALSGHAGQGAAFGAAGGLLVGSAMGSDSGQMTGAMAQRRYDNAYLQCMSAYGNQIPAYPSTPPESPRVVVAPPPPAPAYYPAPPDVVFDEPPRFIFSPSLDMYVAVGVPYDIIYTGSDYLYFSGGRWYRGPHYDGPWAYVPYRSYPPVLRRYRVERIRRFRDREFERFDRDRDRYDGRFYRPEFRGRGRRFER